MELGYLEFAREALKDIYTFCISKCSTLTDVFMFLFYWISWYPCWSAGDTCPQWYRSSCGLYLKRTPEWKAGSAVIQRETDFLPAMMATDSAANLSFPGIILLRNSLISLGGFAVTGVPKTCLLKTAC